MSPRDPFSARNVGLEELIGSHDWLAGVVRKRTGARLEDARDAVSQALAKIAVEDRATYPWPWVLQIATNGMIDDHRKRGTEVAFVERTVSLGYHPPLEFDGNYKHEANPATRLEDVEQLELLTRIIGELPPRCRQLFLLAALEGRAAARAWAAHEGIPDRTVRYYLKEAAAYCVGRLEQENAKTARAPVARRWDRKLKKRLRWNASEERWVKAD